MTILSIKNLSLSIENDQKLNNTGLDINAGDVVLLTGENGCGKSTLIKMIVDEPLTNYYSVNEDYTLTWKGAIDLKKQQNQEEFVRSICYVPQNDVFEANTILDCCLTTLAFSDTITNKIQYIFDFIRKYKFDNLIESSGSDSFFKRNRVRKLLKQVQITDADTKKFEKIAYFLLLDPNRLSGGQKKMVDIICCLVRFQLCDIIILDEPLNALDYSHTRQLSNFLTKIHQENKELSIVIISHCRAILCVNKIYEITNNKIIEKPIEKHYGCFGNIQNDYYI